MDDAAEVGLNRANGDLSLSFVLLVYMNHLFLTFLACDHLKPNEPTSQIVMMRSNLRVMFYLRFFQSWTDKTTGMIAGKSTWYYVSKIIHTKLHEKNKI